MARTKVAYRSIAEQLRTEIEAGAYRDGQLLPSESEVMARFRVSRETARRAYIQLVAAGHASRRQGLGSFAVRRDELVLLSFGSLDDLAAHTRRSKVEVIDPLAIRNQPELAGALGLEDDAVGTLSFLRFREGLAFCTARVGLPPGIARRLIERGAFASTGPNRDDTVLALVESAAGQRIAGASQAWTAVSAPAEVAAQLDLGPAVPVLQLDQTYFNAAGEAVEFARNLFNPERFVYTVRLRHTAL